MRFAFHITKEEQHIKALVKFNGAIKEFRGKSGSANYTKTQYGIEFKNNTTFTKPAMPAQTAQRARVIKAGIVFCAFNPQQNKAWQDYVGTKLVKSKSGERVHPSACTAFIGLYTKFIQVNPDRTLPAVPTGPFAEASITFSAAAQSAK